MACGDRGGMSGVASMRLSVSVCQSVCLGGLLGCQCSSQRPDPWMARSRYISMLQNYFRTLASHENPSMHSPRFVFDEKSTSRWGIDSVSGREPPEVPLRGVDVFWLDQGR